MLSLTFYGASDDLIELEGTKGSEPSEFSPPNGKPGVVKLDHPEEGKMLVFVDYATLNLAGCWMIGISQVEEDVPLPKWKMRWSTHKRCYSSLLEIYVANGTIITQEFPRDTT